MNERGGLAAAGADGARSRLSRLRPFRLELILVAEIVLFHALLAWRGVDFGPGMIVGSLVGVPPQIVMLMLAGLALRLAWLATTGRRDEARSWIVDVRWWVQSARFVLVGALLSHFYTWMKVFVPVIHRRLFDAQLYDVDRFFMFGLQPNVFFLNLFSGPSVIRAIDLGYSELFFSILAFSLAFFLSSRDETTRRSFVAGFVVLWSLGVWTYLALPALGPAYAFPEEFLRFRDQMQGSSLFQRALFENYQQVLRFALGRGEPLINPLFGIAAFPSLHVGHVAFVAIAMNCVAKWTRLPFALAVAFIFIGSVVTGWHYLVDSIAGLALAWLSFHVGVRIAGEDVPQVADGPGSPPPAPPTVAPVR